MPYACDRRFLMLASGTVIGIQLSCVIEEWIFKHLRGFHHFWFVALVELMLFAACSHAAAAIKQSRPLLERPRRPTAPMWLYLMVGLCLAGGTGLGKLAFAYLNYATGTVLKSMKLLPTLALSVCWLRRRFHWLQVAAAVLMVASAALFGLGESAVESTFNPLGITLSLAGLVAQAMQNACNDRILRDHNDSVHVAMAWSNLFGFVFTFLLCAWSGELYSGLAFFSRSWWYWLLLIARCVLFYAGALLYTMLLKESGAVSAVFVTTARKALTVVISFLLFPKPWSDNYSTGFLLLVAAVVCEHRGNTKAKGMLASELLKSVEDGFGRRQFHHLSGRHEGDSERGGADDELREGGENDAEAVPLREKTASEASFLSQADDAEPGLARAEAASCAHDDAGGGDDVCGGSPSATPPRTCPAGVERAYLDVSAYDGSVGDANPKTPMASDAELAELRERLRPRHHAACSTR